MRGEGGFKDCPREVRVKRTIRLKGMNGAVKGQTWEATDLLRIGRLDPLEVVLDDNSVSRRHAEVRATDHGWRVRDLGSTNGTFLNGTRLQPGDHTVRLHDIIRLGNVTIVVDTMQDAGKEDETACPLDNMQVAAVGNQTWEEAFSFAFAPDEG